MVINHPLSASSIYYDTWHPPCSIYVPDSLFAQSLSKFSLVYLLVWHLPLHTPYISSTYHCLLFAARAHTIATCCAVVPRLCHLILVYLSQPFTWNYLLANTTHPSAHWARSHFHAAYYFAHNCCTISLSLSIIHPYW